jgi:PTS system nitrogen regulatory IIA component
MPLHDLIAPDAIISSLKANSKKQALQDMAERAGAISGIPSRQIFDTVLQRERLGPTGVGGGIAIPHGKLLTVKKIFAVFARLDRPVDFESPDGTPVDLICMLIAPESAGADHLKALARVARVLRDPGFVARLRSAKDDSALYLLLTQVLDSRAA